MQCFSDLHQLTSKLLISPPHNPLRPPLDCCWVIFSHLLYTRIWTYLHFTDLCWYNIWMNLISGRWSMCIRDTQCVIHTLLCAPHHSRCNVRPEWWLWSPDLSQFKAASDKSVIEGVLAAVKPPAECSSERRYTFPSGGQLPANPPPPLNLNTPSAQSGRPLTGNHNFHSLVW